MAEEIEHLLYQLRPTHELSFEAAPDLHLSTPGFDADLSKKLLTVTMHDPTLSVGEARSIVDDYLRSWEVHAALGYGVREFSFRFLKALLVTRPVASVEQGEGPATAHIRIESSLTASGEVQKHAIRGKYPEPPTDFTLTPDVETLWFRYCGYREGREPLASMAYFCLTMIEWISGGRTAACRAIGVSQNVLSMLSRLASAGDEHEARKRTPSMRPHTGAERKWIEQVIPALIRRLGQIASGTEPLPLITLADFVKVEDVDVSSAGEGPAANQLDPAT